MHWTSSEFLDGAGEEIRTPDLLITNELLYQLSYTGNQVNRQHVAFDKNPNYEEYRGKLQARVTNIYI